MKKKIFKQEKDNFWCSMWVKRQLILLFFSFIAKFTYVSLSMSVLCHPHNVRGLESTRGRRLSGVDSGLLALWGWYCSCIKCNFHKFIAIIRHWIIKSRFINYFLEKFYHVLLVYKERERMFFSEFSRTEWLYVTSGTLPLSFFSLHCKKIPGVYYYLINCRLHCVGFIASNTQMGFQYPSSGLQRTKLSNLGIVYS